MEEFSIKPSGQVVLLRELARSGLPGTGDHILSALTESSEPPNESPAVTHLKITRGWLGTSLPLLLSLLSALGQGWGRAEPEFCSPARGSPLPKAECPALRVSSYAGLLGFLLAMIEVPFLPWGGPFINPG